MSDPLKPRSLTLACFSPQVILATFVVEASLGIYALWKYRKTAYGKVAAALLLFLSGFQLSELYICGGGASEFWTRFGYVCTAFLPALGIDYIERVTQKKIYTVFAYATAVAFALIIAFYPGLFPLSTCTGMFVAFATDYSGFDIVYPLYYLTALFLGIGLAAVAREKTNLKQVMNWILVAYASFMVPTMFVYLYYAITFSAFSSILCGFAILFALVFSAKVLPLTSKLKPSIL